MRAKTKAWILVGITVAACLWLYYYPVPYGLAVIIVGALPWLAVFIVARSHGLYRLCGRKSSCNPALTPVWLFPGLVLSIRAGYDMHILEWHAMVAIAVVISACFTAASVRVDTYLRGSKVTIAIVFLLSIFYGYGTAMIVNGLLDNSPSKQFEVTVERKYVDCGGRGGCIYNLRLAPWGGFAETSEIGVPHAFYDRVASGGNVCVSLRPGTLHIPWYTMNFRC